MKFMIKIPNFFGKASCEDLSRGLKYNRYLDKSLLSTDTTRSQAESSQLAMNCQHEHSSNLSTSQLPNHLIAVLEPH
jgi:hypothetical protein